MPTRKTVLTVTLTLLAPLALGACGGGSSGSKDGDASTLRVLDYYNNEPDKTVYQKTLEACG